MYHDMHCYYVGINPIPANFGTEAARDSRYHHNGIMGPGQGVK